MAWLTMLPGSADAQEQQTVRWAKLLYPAEGNINPVRGTIAMWFRYDGDVERHLDDRYHRFVLFHYAPPDQPASMTVVCRGNDKSQQNVTLRFELRGRLSGNGEGHQFLAVQFPEDAGAFHHLAVTWDLQAKRMRLFVDGEQRDATSLNGDWWDLWAGTSGGQLGFGHMSQHNSESRLVIDDVHVTEAPLSAEAIAAAQSAPTRVAASTLLLDPLDADFVPNGERQTEATYISGLTGETGGTPSEDAAFVEGRFGRGLRLYTVGDE